MAADQSAAIVVPAVRRIITWDEQGHPVLASEAILTQAHLKSLYSIVAAQPFVCENPLDPDFGKYDGMTVAEVMVRKQIESAAKTGDAALIEQVMDRLIGKPKSTNENLNVNVSGSYEDYVKRKAAELAGAASTSAPGPVEAEVVEPSVFADLT